MKLVGNNGDNVLITFASRPDVTYTVERSTDLSTWTAVETPAQTNDTFYAVTDIGAASGSGRLFYRVVMSGWQPPTP